MSSWYAIKVKLSKLYNQSLYLLCFKGGIDIIAFDDSDNSASDEIKNKKRIAKRRR